MSTRRMDPLNIDQTSIALVTGANKGIGKEIARQLSTEGVLVLIAARDPEHGNTTVADLQTHGLPVEFVQLDVTSQSSVDHVAAEVERRYGRIDILVNNAARGRRIGFPNILAQIGHRQVGDTLTLSWRVRSRLRAYLPGRSSVTFFQFDPSLLWRATLLNHVTSRRYSSWLLC